MGPSAAVAATSFAYCMVFPFLTGASLMPPVRAQSNAFPMLMEVSGSTANNDYVESFLCVVIQAQAGFGPLHRVKLARARRRDIGRFHILSAPTDIRDERIRNRRVLHFLPARP